MSHRQAYSPPRILGTAIVTAQDAVGDTGTATVNVVALATALTVTPFSVQVNKGDVITFSASGGSAPYSFSLSATSIETIVAATGDFTASTIAGTATVTALDSRGISGTATVTVLPDLLTITPAAVVANTAASTTFDEIYVSLTQMFYFHFSDSIHCATG